METLTLVTRSINGKERFLYETTLSIEHSIESTILNTLENLKHMNQLLYNSPNDIIELDLECNILTVKSDLKTISYYFKEYIVNDLITGQIYTSLTEERQKQVLLTIIQEYNLYNANITYSDGNYTLSRGGVE